MGLDDSYLVLPNPRLKLEVDGSDAARDNTLCEGFLELALEDTEAALGLLNVSFQCIFVLG